MKHHIVSLCLAAAVLTGFNAVADDDHKQGGHIKGVENLQVLVRFVATSNAPTGATGVLRLKAHNRDGTNETDMKITTRGLNPGTYDLSATLKSDGSTISLGQITLAPEDGDDNTNSVLVSESEVELDPGISPMDLSSVTISDGTGALLVADIQNAPGQSVAVLNSRVRVTSDAPDVRGTAVLHSLSHKGKQKGNFVMVVKGLEPNTTYHVLVNGTEVGTAKSNKNGELIVHKMAGVNLSTVSSVSLQDDTATTVAEATF